MCQAIFQRDKEGFVSSAQICHVWEAEQDSNQHLPSAEIYSRFYSRFHSRF